MNKIKSAIKENKITIAIISILIFAYFIYSPPKKNYDGCHQFSINLANCTPFECEQYLKGFKNERAGRVEKLSKRIIIGWNTQKDSRTCITTEIDDIESETMTYHCEYKEFDLPKLVHNSAILFGSKTPDRVKDLKGDLMDAYRIQFYERSKQQQESCTDPKQQ